MFQLLGGQIDPKTLKAAIDGGKLSWPPKLNGKATREAVEYENIFKQIAVERKNGKGEQTAFISRTNAPLANAALKLLADGVPFVIVGKDIASDLTHHVDKLLFAKLKNGGAGQLNDNSPLNQLGEKMHDFLQEELDAHGNKSAKRGYLQDLSDTSSALEACIHQFDANAFSVPPVSGHDDNFYDDDQPAVPQQSKQPQGQTVGAFKKWLTDKLGGLDLEENEGDVLTYMDSVEKNKKTSPVVLTTAHKSKGLEFEKVFVLRDDLFPHPKAKRQEDLQQEANGKYVTCTRAMNVLHIVKLEGQPGYKK